MLIYINTEKRQLQEMKFKSSCELAILKEEKYIVVIHTTQAIKSKTK